MRVTFFALEPERNRYRLPSVRPHGGLLQELIPVGVFAETICQEIDECACPLGQIAVLWVYRIGAAPGWAIVLQHHHQVACRNGLPGDK